MQRALMWLNLYGCEAVRHKLKNSLKTQNEVNVRPSMYFKLFFSPAITTVSQYGEGDSHPNYGKNCWEGCDQTQGPCDWCGNESWCCRREPEYEYIGNGCDGTFGGEGKHTCSLNPGILFNISRPKFKSLIPGLNLDLKN